MKTIPQGHSTLGNEMNTGMGAQTIKDVIQNQSQRHPFLPRMSEDPIIQRLTQMERERTDGQSTK